jgi:hypothetical protein
MLAGGVWSVLIMFFTETATQTATVTAPVTRFVTDTGVGDLTVHAGKAGQAVTVRSTLHWAFQRPTLTTNTDNGILTIFSRCPWFWTGSHCSVDLDVTVPPGTALDLRSTTGSVVATAVSAAVSARTSTGDVDVVSTGSAPVTARTNTGDVEVTAEGTDTNVAATSNTGDVTVTLSGIPSSVQARTNTGNVSVAVPPGTGYHVDIGTDTGSQSVSVPRNDLSTRTISAHSNTGDVTVRSAG